jgi:prephenate dehydrogenase
VPTSRSEPAFARVGLVGLGLIGGSIALAIRETAPDAVLIGVDRPDRAEAARRRGAIDHAVASAAALEAVDLVVLAVPPPAVLDILPDLARFGPETVVTDVASTKRHIVSAARAVGLAAFVGGHPMAGSERAGLEHARADLFAARPWLLVEGTGGPATGARLERFVRSLGAEPQWITADAHDRGVAYVSHLPQLVAVALMNAVADGVGHDGLRLAGPAFRDMTRLASSPADLWQGIVPPNADFVEEAVGRFLQSLPTSGDLSRDGWVREVFDRAGAARARWRGDDTTGS